MVTATASPPNHSQVTVFPPLIPLFGFGLGGVIERLVPLESRLAFLQHPALRGAGCVVFAVGLAGFAWMIATMKRARTPIHNGRPSTTLVESGPFRFTRNPMYVFGSTWYAGLAIALVQPWALALLPVVFVVQHYGVVLREEEYLERRFGDAYRSYKSRVPRYW
jgi:protein-S-isoprenylcysteine O-methyltransferase Ste14